MPLREIACPSCAHTGYVVGDRLPGILRCSSCDFAHFVRDGGRVIRSTDAEQLNARAPKARERKQPRPPKLTARGKRVLSPRDEPKPEADAA
jgi:hypothetical protein